MLKALWAGSLCHTITPLLCKQSLRMSHVTKSPKGCLRKEGQGGLVTEKAPFHIQGKYWEFQKKIFSGAKFCLTIEPITKYILNYKKKQKENRPHSKPPSGVTAPHRIASKATGKCFAAITMRISVGLTASVATRVRTSTTRPCLPRGAFRRPFNCLLIIFRGHISGKILQVRV